MDSLYAYFGAKKSSGISSKSSNMSYNQEEILERSNNLLMKLAP